MRISTIQAFNNGVTGIQRNYSNATRTQEQISTGNRILTPADDPVASVRLLQLEQQQNVLTQYDSNLTAAKNSLTQEEVTLNSVNTVLQRVRELAVQAGNGALDPQDRKSIAAELGEREDELLSLMNTRNARGEYLFSGFQGKTPSFVLEGGKYVYKGDEGQRKLQIASSLEIPISDNGKSIFQAVTNAGRLSTNPAAEEIEAPAVRLSSPLIDDEVAFAAFDFPSDGITVKFDATEPKKYEVLKADGTAIYQGWLDEDDESSDKIVFQGMTIHVDGVPTGGETFTIARNEVEKQGILDTVANLRSALESPSTGNGGVRDAVAVALTNLDHGMVSVDQARGNIGARLNVIESTQTDNQDVTLVNKGVQADLRELDYAEALSRLSMQTVVLEAAQQSYVKIAGLSLFNKM